MGIEKQGASESRIKNQELRHSNNFSRILIHSFGGNYLILTCKTIGMCMLDIFFPFQGNHFFHRKSDLLHLQRDEFLVLSQNGDHTGVI